MSEAAGARFVARRLRRSSRAILFIAALRGPGAAGALVTEAAYQLLEAERLSPVRKAS